MRSLLVPQSKLTRELRVLVDARLYLLRAIDQSCLREIVDHGISVIRTVTTSRDPANQIIAIGWGEGENFNELFVCSAGKPHEHEVRLHRLNCLLTVGCLLYTSPSPRDR